MLLMRIAKINSKTVSNLRYTHRSTFTLSTRRYSKPSKQANPDALSYSSKSKHIAKDGSKDVKTKQSKRNRPLHWRLFGITVPLFADPGKDDIGIHDGLLEAICKSLGKSSLRGAQLRVVRKSFDPREKDSKEPQFVYTVDAQFSNSSMVPRSLKEKQGAAEVLRNPVSSCASSTSSSSTSSSGCSASSSQIGAQADSRPRVVIVGAGPAGLFAALTLAEAGWRPLVIERGKRVEDRGRSIGALFNRQILNPDSNLCFGEGGAGTWSDGKLTTRIGKNSEDVQVVLRLLVRHGAPPQILVTGKPHLGTDRLVRLLKQLRAHLQGLGADFLFNSTVSDLDVQGGMVRAVVLATGEHIEADRVVLAVGHSARELCTLLQQRGVRLEAQAIAAGFRIEHPQELINRIQLGRFSELCDRGMGKVPVADYRLAQQLGDRSCYSFCMCPGGQIVPTAVSEDELCLNGMSFSRRQSPFANAALVVTVRPVDMGAAMGGRSDSLVGMDWQREIERKAAQMGGGKLVAPVQRAADFLEGRVSSGEIKSSYRMGVKAAACHDLYPAFVTDTLREALCSFERRLPGFICENAILHGVETRTSAPVRIVRDTDNLTSETIRNLYPAGEGAGYAGGIISAAVDGMKVAASILQDEGQEVDWASLLRQVEIPWTVVAG